MFKRIRHGKPKALQNMVGFPKEDVGKFAELREAVYQEFFGLSDQVSHELIPLIPHIDIWIHPPGFRGRNFFTLVTSGMSDMPMNLESQVPKSYARRELIIYTADNQGAYISLLRNIARFPFEYSTWVGVGHTIPNGSPPAPIFQDSELVSVILFPAMLDPEQTLPRKVVLNGDPVEFLWLVPLTQTELDFKLEHGIEALAEELGKAKGWPVLDPNRKSSI
jgi:hypothetical protein